MSYRVVYVPTEYPENPQCGAGIRLLMLSGSFLLILLALTAAFWSEGKEVLEALAEARGSLISRQALEAMASHLRQGMPVGEAVTAFCRDVISEGYLIGQ